VCGLRFGIQSAGGFGGLMWLRMARRNMVCMANKPLQPGLGYRRILIPMYWEQVGLNITITDKLKNGCHIDG